MFSILGEAGAELLLFLQAHLPYMELLQTARVFGKLMQQGWRPKRTIVLCSWDAEEYGMVSIAPDNFYLSCVSIFSRS